jgi:hypothetical protein
MKIWQKYQGSLVPSIAPHCPIDLSKKEAKDLLKKHRAYLIRWPINFDQIKKSTFWYVIKDGESSLDELSGNTRSKVRRGLKKLEVKKLAKHEVVDHGAYKVYLAANESYDHYVSPMNEEDFITQILSYSDEECHFWGVFMKEDNHLVAYSQNLLSDKSCNYSVIKFHPLYLKYYLSYALFFEMNNYYLNELNFRYINDGARSIGHDTSIQEFLIEKFKFRKAYCNLELYYSNKVKLVVVLLYPFRSLFFKRSFKLFKMIGILLKQHEIYLNQNKG